MNEDWYAFGCCIILGIIFAIILVIRTLLYMY